MAISVHVAQSSDAISPESLDWDAPLELEVKFREELNGGINVCATTMPTLSIRLTAMASPFASDVRRKGRLAAFRKTSP